MELTATERLKRMNTKDLMEHYSITYQTLWRHVRIGQIPKPRYAGLKKPYWLFGDLVDHDLKGSTKRETKGQKLRKLLNL